MCPDHHVMCSSASQYVGCRQSPHFKPAYYSTWLTQKGLRGVENSRDRPLSLNDGVYCFQIIEAQAQPS